MIIFKGTRERRQHRKMGHEIGEWLDYGEWSYWICSCGEHWPKTKPHESPEDFKARHNLP